MDNRQDISTMGEAQFEEWFLAGIGSDAMPVEAMLGALRERHQRGMTEQSDSWAELMDETFAERGRVEETIRVLRVRAEWHAADPGFRAYCEKRIAWLYRNDPVRKKFVGNIGLNKTVALSECFRRLDTLQRLSAGVLCLDSTWGVGAVKYVDAFYERVTIDFDKKAGHEMSFAYAAEALRFVADDHLLARKYRDAAGLAALAAGNPAEVVRIALRSYGPLPVGRIQEILADGIVKTADWKTFWDGARKGLKADPLVTIPAKRSDPIVLLDRAATCDAAWFTALTTLRTPEGVFAKLDELADKVTPEALDDAGRKAVGDRLAFLMLGFGDKDMGIRVRIALLAREWKIAAEQVDWVREAREFLAPARFMSAASELSSKRLDTFLRFLADRDPAATAATLAACLPEMTLNVLNVCADFLIETGSEPALAGVFKELVGRRQAGVETLFWLARRPEKLKAWGLGTTGDLAFHIMPSLEQTYTFERLKAANQLAELVQQKAWLESAVDSMNEVQRSSFVRSLRAVMGRVPADTQTMIGRIVMKYPDLAALLTEKKDEGGGARPQGGFTSWRAVRQRQQQLEKLISEDIPKNSRDIGVARSYGDLRENFEYKSAKEQQGILLRRREEWEEGLKQIKGTDFSGFPVDAAGMGTQVLLRYPDGHTQRFFVLGEWDQDTELGIISCSSRMGRVLTGRRAGDEVTVPGEPDDIPCRVEEVGGLPEHIQIWARGV